MKQNNLEKSGNIVVKKRPKSTIKCPGKNQIKTKQPTKHSKHFTALKLLLFNVY